MHARRVVNEYLSVCPFRSVSVSACAVLQLSLYLHNELCSTYIHTHTHTHTHKHTHTHTQCQLYFLSFANLLTVPLQAVTLYCDAVWTLEAAMKLKAYSCGLWTTVKRPHHFLRIWKQPSLQGSEKFWSCYNIIYGKFNGLIKPENAIKKRPLKRTDIFPLINELFKTSNT